MGYWSNVVVLMVGIGMMFAAAVLRPQSDLFWPALSAGLAISIWALYADDRRKKQSERRIADHVANRIRDLTGGPWCSNQRLVVPGQYWPAIAIFLCLIGGAFLVFAELSGPTASAVPLIAGAILLVLGVVIGPHVFMAVGRPSLVLNNQGIEVPIEGRLPWSAVEGISLQVTQPKRGNKLFVILFLVPSFGAGGTKVSWVSRYQSWFGLGPLKRKIFAAGLPTSAERPEVVDAVAKHLWAQATGRTNSWNPWRSTAGNAAASRLHSLGRRIDANLAAASEQAAGKDKEGLLNTAQQTLTDLEQFTETRATLVRDVQEQQKTRKWVAAFGLLGVVALVLLAMA